MWTRITRCSDRRSYHPRRVSLSLLGRSARQLRTLTTEILSFDEMRRDTPLDAVIESFFRANYDLSPKTEEFYRLSLRVLRVDHAAPPTRADRRRRGPRPGK